VQHLQLNLNKTTTGQGGVANLQRGFFCHLGKTNSKLLGRIFQKFLLFSWETHMTHVLIVVKSSGRNQAEEQVS
jgi:hypothetical protein